MRRAVTAVDGSYRVPASGNGLLHSRSGNGTNIFTFSNEIFEQRTIDLGVVPLLSEMYAVHLFGLNLWRHVTVELVDETFEAVEVVDSSLKDDPVDKTEAERLRPRMVAESTKSRWVQRLKTP